MTIPTETLEKLLRSAKDAKEGGWEYVNQRVEHAIALIEELKELREFEAEMALRSRPK